MKKQLRTLITAIVLAAFAAAASSCTVLKVKKKYVSADQAPTQQNYR